MVVIRVEVDLVERLLAVAVAAAVVVEVVEVSQRAEEKEGRYRNDPLIQICYHLNVADAISCADDGVHDEWAVKAEAWQARSWLNLTLPKSSCVTRDGRCWYRTVPRNEIRVRCSTWAWRRRSWLDFEGTVLVHLDWAEKVKVERVVVEVKMIH
jgi:hypothetical protein